MRYTVVAVGKLKERFWADACAESLKRLQPYAKTSVTEVSDGKFALVSTPEGSEEQTVIYELEGKPVTLILYNMVFIVPQNLNDNTWNLIAHPLGDGSVTQPVTDSEGKPLIGEGEISEAKLVGDTIQVTTTTGESYEVSLV